MLTLILLLTAVCFLAATARRWHPQAAFQDLRRRWDPSLVLIAVLLALLIGRRRKAPAAMGIPYVRK